MTPKIGADFRKARAASAARHAPDQNVRAFPRLREKRKRFEEGSL
ncbi:hypothetical protein ACFWXH_24120 [Mesorhizobium sp. NPDC059054]